MKPATASLRLLATSLLMLPLGNAFPASASWNVTTGGNWSDNANWSPAAYPGSGVAENQVATFSQGGSGVLAIQLDVDVTLGGITMTPGASRGYVVSSSTGKTITLQNTTGTATLGFSGGGGGDREFSNAFRLDTDIINITGRKMLFSGALSAVNDRNITLNVTANSATPGGTFLDTLIFRSANNFGQGQMNVSGTSAVVLQNALAAGGADTAIHFTDLTNRTTLALNTSGEVSYGNRLVVNTGARGQILVRQGGVSNSSTIASLRVNQGGEFRLSGDIGDGRVFFTQGMHIAAGSLVLAQTDSTQSNRSIQGRLLSGAVLSGEGTLATAVNGSSQNLPITLASGAVLAPGDPDVAGSTGILTLGSATYTESRLTLESGSRIRFDLNGLAAGTGYDQIRVLESSTFSLSGAVAEFHLLWQDYAVDDVLTLIQFASGATRVGQFAGLDEDALVTLDGWGTANISYLGGASGQDITLTNFQVVPEPGVAGLVALGLGMVWCARRRRSA